MVCDHDYFTNVSKVSEIVYAANDTDGNTL